jgi:hypothetical protein
LFKAREIHRAEVAAAERKLLEGDSTAEDFKEERINESQRALTNADSVIVINGQTFDLTVSEEQTAELMQLKKLAESELSHGQWVKQLMCFSLIGILIFMNLSLGSSEKSSIDGIKLCSFTYWFIQLVFIAICAVFTWFAVKLNKKEQDLRRKYNINYIDGEIIFEGSILYKLLLIGFAGGWVAGGLGLGGGSIYNPALLALGVHPRVAASTGMYLVIFSGINACVVNFLAGILDVKYGLFIGGWVVLGSLLGLMLADAYVKKSGKQSIFVWLLCLVFIIAAVVTPFVAYN